MAEKKEKQNEFIAPDIPEIFLKPYDSKVHEDKIYEKWTASDFFNPDACIEKGITSPDAETFSIVLPPPNVTGTLHMGHAAMLAVEDILVRYHRMNGKRTLWIPGTDSAAIATQSKVEKEIYKKEKKSRHDLGRDELLKRIDAFAEESKNTIINQTKKMGSSLDWSRYAFTLDDKRYGAVMEAFVRMYNAGLIYRGNRIVNWDPKGQTTISDDEIVYKEEKTKFYYFKYGPFTIGTSRPETKFGDKYVVMHPDDARYKEYTHGQKIELEWINGPIKAMIVKDESIDMEFGTGVMTITPWHSAVDFEIAERHGLDKEQIINEYGKMLPAAGEFEGMKIAEAREKIVEKLKEKGLFVKEEDYTHNISTAERTGGIIEPQIKRQWFVGVDKEFTMGHSEIPGVKEGDTVTLKKLMMASVENGGTTIFPDRFQKVYYHWIKNLHDWCISRQIWYGHRIPVWYKGNEVFCGTKAPDGEGWEQDPDTLDTWFSSGLWTFSTLGWPEQTEDLKTYHPTTLLETGYDILPFWVARMILMSTFHLGQVPFKHVYFHGLVRDNQNRKMSKSLGNIIDPLDMIEKYGTDATRLSLVIGAAPGNDVPLSEDKVRGYKHFANKLWNISRFVLTNLVDADFTTKPPFSKRDEEILAGLHNITAEISIDIEKYNLYLAGEKAYHYVWHELADKILEESKLVFSEGTKDEKRSRQYVLRECLVTSLKLLHPFMPFVTEAIWENLPTPVGKDERELLMVASWPSVDLK